MKCAALSPWLLFFVLINTFNIVLCPAQGYAGSNAEQRSPGSPPAFVFDLSEEFQPDYVKPRQYSRSEMKAMAREAALKIQERSGQYFSRMDPQHIGYLAEFFGLMSDENLDPYSTPMQDADIRYFAEVSEHEDKELYPETAEDLIIRFYWEGLVRAAAAHYKMAVVNEKRDSHPEKSRAKVSDMATTAMFDKTPGMSTAYARKLGAERYDFNLLVTHLKLKGLRTR